MPAVRPTSGSAQGRSGFAGSESSRPSGEATRKLATTRQSPATVAAAKAGAVPTALAKAPMTGPTRAPATETPRARPRAPPRRSGGVPPASQAIPPAQMQAPQALGKARRVEHDDGVAEAEHERGSAHEKEPEHDSGPDTETGREDAHSESAATKVPRGIGGDEDPDRCLGESEGVDIVGQNGVSAVKNTVSTSTSTHTKAKRPRAFALIGPLPSTLKTTLSVLPHLAPLWPGAGLGLLEYWCRLGGAVRPETPLPAGA